MEIAFVGLGKMGGNMVRRLLQGGHKVVAFDRDSAVVDGLAKEGATPAKSLQDVCSKFSGAKVIWIMVPAGAPVDETIDALIPTLSAGDLVIDGGNSRFTDSIARGAKLKEKGIYFVDAGTSGGIWGLQVGYCLMVGGEKKAIEMLSPALETLAPPNGYLHVGDIGAGHYTKMIHNGIEYGLMQAYAEGFELLECSQFKVDLPKVARLWNQGSVVRSWLLELAEKMLADDPKLSELKGYVEDSGEGRWTVEESINLRVPAPVITLALQARFRSRRENTFSDRFLAALRNQFGGHAVKNK